MTTKLTLKSTNRKMADECYTLVFSDEDDADEAIYYINAIESILLEKCSSFSIHIEKSEDEDIINFDEFS